MSGRFHFDDVFDEPWREPCAWWAADGAWYQDGRKVSFLGHVEGGKAGFQKWCRQARIPFEDWTVEKLPVHLAAVC
jgi:hypothetical protein